MRGLPRTNQNRATPMLSNRNKSWGLILLLSFVIACCVEVVHYHAPLVWKSVKSRVGCYDQTEAATLVKDSKELHTDSKELLKRLQSQLTTEDLASTLLSDQVLENALRQRFRDERTRAPTSETDVSDDLMDLQDEADAEDAAAIDDTQKMLDSFVPNTQTVPNICETWVRRNAPHQPTKCSRGNHPLVIIAGEGKTGTTAVTWAVTRLGYVTGHWDSVYVPRCRRGGWGGDQRNGRPGCKGEVIDVSTDGQRSAEYNKIRKDLMALERAKYDSFDFCQPFLELDAVADVPIGQLFPWVYTAHRHRDVKVILTVRNATEWAARRHSWAKDSQQGDGTWSDIAPMGMLFAKSVYDGYKPQNPYSIAGAMGTKDVDVKANDIKFRSGLGAIAWGYLAQVSLLSCMVPPEDLLVLNLFEEREEDLWFRLAKFLKKPLTGVNLKLFGGWKDDKAVKRKTIVEEKQSN